jgi:hypothetical protein
MLAIIPESNHELYPSPRNILDDADSISTNSLSGNHRAQLQLSEERLDSLRLVRSRSNSSSFSNTGYLFLAIVFCMMCCSSLIVAPDLASHISTRNIPILMKGGVPTANVGNRQLMNHDKAQKQAVNNLAQALDDDIEMTVPLHNNKISIEKEPGSGAVQLIKMLLTGQYTYLTYMLLSTTCFFFWLMPNFNKVRSLFGTRHQSGPITRSSSRRTGEAAERQNHTRSQSKVPQRQ